MEEKIRIYELSEKLLDFLDSQDCSWTEIIVALELAKTTIQSWMINRTDEEDDEDEEYEITGIKHNKEISQFPMSGQLITWNKDNDTNLKEE